MKKSSSRGKSQFKHLSMVALSKVMDGVEDGKVSLVQKAIERIDGVASRYQGIMTMYLSGNFIEDLTMIGQFPQLKVLSLAGNNISDLRTLRHLTKLPRLENLCLSGNPVTKHQIYRPYVIGYCRVLKNLDSQTITTQHHSECEQQLVYF